MIDCQKLLERIEEAGGGREGGAFYVSRYSLGDTIISDLGF